MIWLRIDKNLETFKLVGRTDSVNEGVDQNNVPVVSQLFSGDQFSMDVVLTLRGASHHSSLVEKRFV
jgi:hypothetical protein